MIKANTQQIQQLERMLARVARRGAGYAARGAVNGLAFKTQQVARQTIQQDFTNRNRWTQGSVRVTTARRPNDPAIVGSTEEYMADQEFGAVGGPRNVPTPAASGESPRAKVRTKVVRRTNRMNAIKLGRKVRGSMSRAQANIAALKGAKASGQRFVYMDRGKVKGIYRVMGTKRKPKARMVQNLTRSVRRVRQHRWLLPSSTTAQQQHAAPMYFNELRKQLRRASSATGVTR